MIAVCTFILLYFCLIVHMNMIAANIPPPAEETGPDFLGFKHKICDSFCFFLTLNCRKGEIFVAHVMMMLPVN